jgi:hypothetical protein
MAQALSPKNSVVIRPMQYRDREVVERLLAEGLEADGVSCSVDPDRPFKHLRMRPWSGLWRALNLLLSPMQYAFCAHPAEQDGDIQGVIRVSPFNRTRSTWRVDQVAVNTPSSADPAAVAQDTLAPTPVEAASAASEPHGLSPKPLLSNIGSQLLRHCFEKVWEARTWLLEVNVSDNTALALYRQNGFQPLAHMTYWKIAPELLQEIAEREPDLPNLLPVSNADAQLLYQLDTASMPPLVRQVFDRHMVDFKTSLMGSLMEGLKNWLTHTEVVSGYVFEPQRKAAIGYFQIRLCQDGSHPHQAQLTVHPAYTWLYPELMTQMARIIQELPAQALHLVSSDYQSEREEYLERLGANRLAHTLMMSRSVWHKVRETKPVVEGLQLSEVLQGLKPARKAIPSRITLLRSLNHSLQTSSTSDASAAPRQTSADVETPGRNKNSRMNLPISSDFSDPPQEGPCC